MTILIDADQAGSEEAGVNANPSGPTRAPTDADDKPPSDSKTNSETIQASHTKDTSSNDGLRVFSLADWQARRRAQQGAGQPQDIFAGSSSKRLTSRSSIHKTTTATPIGTPRTSEHVAQLHDLCQKNAVPQPEFDYFEVPLEGDARRNGCTTGFGARLTIDLRKYEPNFNPNGSTFEEMFKGLNVLEVDRPYNTKKEAKEAVCVRGVEVMRTFDEEQQHKKKGNSVAGGSETSTTVMDIDEENWIGLLQEHALATRLSPPSYQLYTLNEGPIVRFACALTHPLRPSEPFGYSANTAPTTTSDISPKATVQTTRYASKKAARAAAAKEGVIWLRENRHLSTSGGPVRKKARSASYALGDNSNANGTSLCSNGVGSRPASASHDVQSNDTSPALKASDEPADTSYPQTAAQHAVRLGLTAVVYHITPSLAAQGSNTPTTTNAFWDVVATLTGRELGGGGEDEVVGRAERVYGKKAAKEECARDVEKWMCAEEARRMEGFDDLPWGIKGGGERGGDAMEEG